MPRKVYLSMKAFQEITKFSSQYASNYLLREKWVECMGYLFCKAEGDRYIIGDAVGISRGGETYVSMTPDDLAKIEKLDADRPDLFLGGWFHTHPGLSPFFSETDILNQMFYQAGNEDGLGLVFDHSMVSPDFIGFKIFRLDDPQDPNTRYHEVEWFPLDWTLEGLEQAFQPIGVSHRIIDALAYKLGITKTAPKADLPPFVMPKVKDKQHALTLIKNTQMSSEKAFRERDFLRALISKRVLIALLRQYGTNEERADELIEFVEWAIEANKILAAEEMLSELEIMEEDGELPSDMELYYKARIRFLRGLLYKKQFRFGNAIEKFKEAFTLFKEDENDEDTGLTCMYISECLDAQKEYKMALEWIEKAEHFIKEAINDAEEDEDSDEDYLEDLKTILKKIYSLKMRIKAKLSVMKKGPMRIA